MKSIQYKNQTKKRKQPEGDHQKSLGLMLNGILKPRLNHFLDIFRSRRKKIIKNRNLTKKKRFNAWGF